MGRHRIRPCGRQRGRILAVEAVVPNREYSHDPVPEQVLGIAMDQRAFGPRQLMAVFGGLDGRFLAITFTDRTDPVDDALRGCLLHFDALGRGGEAHCAAVVLCDEAVQDGPDMSAFMAKFERAKRVAQAHQVHLVDWIACDDDHFRAARLSSYSPATDPAWWDVPPPSSW